MNSETGPCGTPLPCPFCGSASNAPVAIGHRWRECGNCGAVGPSGGNWNLRAETLEQRRMRETLERIVTLACWNAPLDSLPTLMHSIHAEAVYTLVRKGETI